MSSLQIMTMLGLVSTAFMENATAQVLSANSACVAGRCSWFLVIMDFSESENGFLAKMANAMNNTSCHKQ